jgi:hypothetical protein
VSASASAYPPPIFIKDDVAYHPQPLLPPGAVAPVFSGSDVTAAVSVPGIASAPGSQAASAVYSEAWLQDLLYRFPAALPVRELVPSMQALVPICKELNTDAGYADLLYLTPAGQIVLVETKLWQNSEGRREVVAQILDYAKMMTRWTYDKLDSQVAKATKQGPGFLLKTMRERFEDLDPKTFINGVSTHLQTGDMLLLIVGDVIKPSAEALVNFMQEYGSLRFSFGLIDVAAHALEGGILLQPRVLAKTEVIRRTIFLPQVLTNGTSIGEAIDSQAGPAEGLLKQGESPEYSKLNDWYFEFWTQFIKRLTLEDPSQPPPKPTRDTNVYLAMPPGMNSCWLSTYMARAGGTMGVYVTWMKAYSLNREMYESLLAVKDEIEMQVGTALSWSAVNDKYVLEVKKPLPNVETAAGREEAMQYLLQMTNLMVNAVRSRIQAFLDAQKLVQG